MARYTADEMRKMASAVLNECEDSEHGLLYPSRYLSGHLFYPEDAAKMLRQSADMMERERKHEYEYAARYFYPSGVIATAYIFDNLTDAKLFSVSRDGAKKIICRREVGEWKEVE